MRAFASAVLPVTLAGKGDASCAGHAQHSTGMSMRFGMYRGMTSGAGPRTMAAQAPLVHEIQGVTELCVGAVHDPRRPVLDHVRLAHQCFGGGGGISIVARLPAIYQHPKAFTMRPLGSAALPRTLSGKGGVVCAGHAKCSNGAGARSGPVIDRQGQIEGMQLHDTKVPIARSKAVDVDLKACAAAVYGAVVAPGPKALEWKTPSSKTRVMSERKTSTTAKTRHALRFARHKTTIRSQPVHNCKELVEGS